MFSTFDLCLLLYVIRLAGWLKHCSLSLSPKLSSLCASSCEGIGSALTLAAQASQLHYNRTAFQLVTRLWQAGLITQR